MIEFCNSRKFFLKKVLYSGFSIFRLVVRFLIWGKRWRKRVLRGVFFLN